VSESLPPPGAPAVAQPVVHVFEGTVNLTDGSTAVVDARWPTPTTLARYATLPVDVPVTATSAEAELAWTGAPGFLGFALANATEPWCGALPGAADHASCVTPLPQRAGERWSIVLVGDPQAMPPPQVAYKVTLTLRFAPLPLLDPPLPFGPQAALQFAPPVPVDAARPAVEPSIAVTPGGDEYVAALVNEPGGLYKAHAGGPFARVDLPLAFCDNDLLQVPVPYPTATHVGCGDTDVAAASDKDVYFTYHWGDEGVAATHDGGATWTTQPLGTGPELHTDRQWLATNGATEAWLAYDGMTTYAGLGSYVSHTLDGGLTWLNAGKVLQNTACVTGLARAPAPKTTLYVVGCDAHGPGIAVSHDGGLTFAWHAIAERSVPDFFLKVATDAAGTVNVAWSEPDPLGGARIVLARSADEGATWSAPQALPLPPGTYVQPALTGGAAGHLAVAFYGTRDRGLGEQKGPSKFDAGTFDAPEHVLGAWYPLVAETTDGGATWELGAVSATPVQRGPICLGGNGCLTGRNLGDFFQVQADARGMLHVAFVDGHLEPARSFARAMVARQVGGVSLGGPSVEKDGGAPAALLAAAR
jgi:hypothetical protein